MILSANSSWLPNAGINGNKRPSLSMVSCQSVNQSLHCLCTFTMPGYLPLVKSPENVMKSAQTLETSVKAFLLSSIQLQDSTMGAASLVSPADINATGSLGLSESVLNFSLLLTLPEPSLITA